MSLNVYEIITERIIASLESGTVPWRTTPWRTSAPINLISRKKYRGVNVFLLNARIMTPLCDECYMYDCEYEPPPTEEEMREYDRMRAQERTKRLREQGLPTLHYRLADILPKVKR